MLQSRGRRRLFTCCLQTFPLGPQSKHLNQNHRRRCLGLRALLAGCFLVSGFWFGQTSRPVSFNCVDVAVGICEAETKVMIFEPKRSPA